MREEMKKVKEMEAFKIYNGKADDLFDYKKITTHIVFDIKLGENFRRKARLVADGHKTDPPSSVTHSSVVSRDSTFKQQMWKMHVSLQPVEKRHTRLL